METLESADSLYDRLGGDSAIEAAVELFYGKVLADPLLAPFFRDLDMGAQVAKMIAFMAWAFDGPSAYRGRDLSEAHSELVHKQGLADLHFDAVTAHLRSTLEELAIPAPLGDEIIARVGGTRDAVLCRKP